MFFEATSFNHPIETWDVSKVENMTAMFYRATSFNQSLGGWDVSRVTDRDNFAVGAVLLVDLPEFPNL